jgi:hypothetical protein
MEPKTFERRYVYIVGGGLLVLTLLAGIVIDRLGILGPGFTQNGVLMSDQDRTVALVQKWAHMNQKKPKSADQLATLWSPNQALQFWPDACQLLTNDVQTAFPERPGLANGDIRVADFNDPKNPKGQVKTVGDLAKLIRESPAQ